MAKCPVDILASILSWLPHKDHARACGVGRVWRAAGARAVSKSPFWMLVGNDIDGLTQQLARGYVSERTTRVSWLENDRFDEMFQVMLQTNVSFAGVQHLEYVAHDLDHIARMPILLQAPLRTLDLSVHYVYDSDHIDELMKRIQAQSTLETLSIACFRNKLDVFPWRLQLTSLHQLRKLTLVYITDTQNSMLTLPPTLEALTLIRCTGIPSLPALPAALRHLEVTHSTHFILPKIEDALATTPLLDTLMLTRNPGGYALRTSQALTKCLSIRLPRLRDLATDAVDVSAAIIMGLSHWHCFPALQRLLLVVDDNQTIDQLTKRLVKRSTPIPQLSIIDRRANGHRASGHHPFRPFMGQLACAGYPNVACHFSACSEDTRVVYARVRDALAPLSYRLVIGRTRVQILRCNAKCPGITLATDEETGVKDTCACLKGRWHVDIADPIEFWHDYKHI